MYRPTLGIIGGGQLGSFLSDAAKKIQIKTVIFSDDINAPAKHFADRIIILYEGKIVATGKIKNVLTEPTHQYTKALIDAISEPDPKNLYKEKKIDWQIK